MCDDVTIIKVCAFIVSSDTVHLKYSNANLWLPLEGLAAQHAARDPPQGPCVQGPAWEVELVTGFSFPCSPVECCIMETNHKSTLAEKSMYVLCELVQ